MVQFLDSEIVKMDKKIQDAETVEMVWFLDPEIIEKVDKSFMSPSIALPAQLVFVFSYEAFPYMGQT